MSLRGAQLAGSRLLRCSRLSSSLHHSSDGVQLGHAEPTAHCERMAASARYSSSAQQCLHSAAAGWQQCRLRSFASSAAEHPQPAGQGAAQELDVPTAEASGAAVPEQYSRIAKITDKYKVPRKLAFAVVEVGPTQFKVAQGDLIVTEKLLGVDVNDQISLNRVLMLGSPHETIIGRPFIPNAVVTAAVEEQFQDGKVLIFKKRRRKNSRRLNGHRQALTTLRIMDVIGIEAEELPAPKKAVRPRQPLKHAREPREEALVVG